MSSLPDKTRILVLGGGFGGVATARRLETLYRRRPDVEITLVSQDNFVLMTPLLFEVFSGSLDIKSCTVPIRAFLGSTRFVEATVQSIDLDKRVVRVAAPGTLAELGYDQLVIALGSKSNRTMIAGSEHAFTFKNLADALLLRNHVIERFERADVESSWERKSQLLTFVIIGGGLVGVELLGELTAFVDGILPLYEHIDSGDVRFVLLEAGERLMPEIDPTLAAYGARILAARRGVDVRTHAIVRAIDPQKVRLPNETIVADTIVLTAGVVPNPVVAGLPLEKDARGCLKVDPTLRCQDHPEVWALGDCASIPGPDGKPYPRLAQHALRAARVLARNIYRVQNHRPPKPFIYHTLGMMGSLGHNIGFAHFLRIRMHGFLAWFLRRTYYLWQMPGWSRRLRMMIDWTFGLLLRPDVVKVSLTSETASLLRETAQLDTAAGVQRTSGATASATFARPLVPAQPETKWPAYVFTD
jgi:NADH dehydrogenase